MTKNFANELIDTYKNSRKIAFSLAEVLITLGIIGVVAALTLPTLIQNYQKQATANKVKKFYTNFNQVIRYSELDNGDCNTWNINDSNELYDKYLSKYLKVVQVQRNIHLYGYFTGGVKFIFADGTQAMCSKESNGFYYFNPIAVCLFFPRGCSRWYASPDNGTCDYTHSTREIFWFILNQNGKLEPPNLNRDRAYNIQKCKEFHSITHNGFTDCSTLLYKDNWEFKKDYPW